MSDKQVKRGVSKAEWLRAGMEALSNGSITEVTVEGLARELKIAKAGFYWHFKNRQELLTQMLDYWVHELTEVITQNQQLLALEPKKRLITTAEMILEYDLARYDIAFRQWASQDQSASRAVKKVNRIRLDFVKKALSELGVPGIELEMRAMLFVCYHTWESLMFQEISRKKRRELISSRIELIISR